MYFTKHSSLHPSSFIHVVANDKFSFFLWSNNIHYVYTGVKKCLCVYIHICTYIYECVCHIFSLQSLTLRLFLCLGCYNVALNMCAYLFQFCFIYISYYSLYPIIHGFCAKVFSLCNSILLEFQTSNFQK